MAAYWDSLAVPFLLDDQSAVLRNKTISGKAGIWDLVWAKNAGTASGRPIYNLSLALNFLWGRYDTLSYHVVNLGAHVACGLVLLCLIRLTFNHAFVGLPVQRHAFTVSALTGLIWLLHPLQTEAVTYISQRSEILMAFFYLLTVLALGKGLQAETSTAGQTFQSSSRRSRPWLILSVFACFCGMASKEVMVTAPFVALLYHRIFFRTTFRKILTMHPVYYLSLFSSLGFLAFLLRISSLGERTVGLGFGLSPIAYLGAEVFAIGRYLRLALWPSGLVFDYGREIAYRGTPIFFTIAIVAISSVAAFLLFKRSRTAGFLLTTPFIILLPSSSLIPIVADPVVESRMYLPLAPIVALVVSYLILKWPMRPVVCILLLCSMVLGISAHRRNMAYESALSIWRDSVEKEPGSSRAQDNFAVEIAKDPSRRAEAISHFERAIEIRPNFPEAIKNLARETAEIPNGHQKAIEGFRRAISLRPNDAEAMDSLAIELGKDPETFSAAILEFQNACKADPNYSDPHTNLGALLAKMGRMGEAVAQFKLAVTIDPQSAEAYNDLGAVEARDPSTMAEAIGHIERAIKLDPNYFGARENLAKLLALDPSRWPEAIQEYDAILAASPGNEGALVGKAKLLARMSGRQAEAAELLEGVLRSNSSDVAAYVELGDLLAQMPGRSEEARIQFMSALKLRPRLPEAFNGLAVIDASEGHLAEALRELRMALEIKPGYKAALDNLRALDPQEK